MAMSAWLPTFGGCWEAGVEVVTVHTSITWSMGGGTWSSTSQMSSLRNFVSRFKYSLSFSDSSTPVCSGLLLALQENFRELGLKMLTMFFSLLQCVNGCAIYTDVVYLRINVEIDIVPLALFHANVALINGI